MLRKVLLCIGVGALALSVTACNTVKGMGKDITSVGEAGSKAM